MSEHNTEETIFFGIQIPKGTILPEDLQPKSYYTDQLEALKILKKVKPARMKKFSSSEEAAAFSESDCINEQINGDNGESAETLPYKSLKLTELVQLRNAIEKGDIVTIEQLVNSNPRYLIAAGDTPTILQERYRYNGLHSAAMKGQAKAAEVILNYLSNYEIYTKLYANDAMETRRDRMKFLLDLYLNTPDKGFHETPLHFACKFGHVEMVSLLLNEALINKQSLNKEGKQADQIICTRSGTADDRKSITDIFLGQFYIPLYRSECDDVVPEIGEPWSPEGRVSSDFRNYPTGQTDEYGMIKVSSPLRAAHQNQLPAIANKGKGDSSSPLVVKALAGPMSPQQAIDFKRSLRSLSHSSHSPLRSSNLPHSPLRSTVSSPLKNKELCDSARKDPYKGLEIVGRSLASEFNVCWQEYWQFLDCAVDIRSSAGLQLLEKHLRKQQENMESLVKPAVREKKTPDAAKQLFSTPVKSANNLVIENIQVTPLMSTENSQNYRQLNSLQNSNTPVLSAKIKPDQPNVMNSKSGEKSFQSPKSGRNINNPGFAAGDALNTTDDQLAARFQGLTIHSPSSPNYIRYSSSNTRAGSEHLNADASFKDGGGDFKRHNTSLSSKTGHDETRKAHRSYLELVVPSLAVYVDKIRRFWPFGKSHPQAKTDNLSQSCDSITDGNLTNIQEHRTPQKSPLPKEMTTPEHIYVNQEHSTLEGSSDGSDNPTHAEFLLNRPADASTEMPPANVFLLGAEPTKADTDVMMALSGVAVDEAKYPAVTSWLNNVTTFSKQEQMSWTTPITVRHRSRLRDKQGNTTPRRLDVTTKLVLD